ncbi:MAG: WbqC family protein, partial [Patescibacteria group bacterium]
IDNSKNWQVSQLSIIKENYSKAPYFKDYYHFFEETLRRGSGQAWEKVCDLDVYLIKNIIGFLGIKNKIETASELKIESTKTERLVEICKKMGADTYLSGPGGKNYMDLSLFEKENIKVVFCDLVSPKYNQQYGEFLPGMSVIDLLFNEGPKSLKIIQSYG